MVQDEKIVRENVYEIERWFDEGKSIREISLWIDVGWYFTYKHIRNYVRSQYNVKLSWELEQKYRDAMGLLYDIQKEIDASLRQKKCTLCESLFIPKVRSREYICDACKSNYHIKHEISIVKNQLNRARRNNLPATLTVKQWLDILDRNEWLCHWCDGVKADYEQMDHVVPISHGGGTVANNVVPSCKKCNLSRNGKMNGWGKKKDDSKHDL